MQTSPPTKPTREIKTSITHQIGFALPLASALRVYPQVGVHVVGADPSVRVADGRQSSSLQRDLQEQEDTALPQQDPHPPGEQHQQHLRTFSWAMAGTELEVVLVCLGWLFVCWFVW